eukprot:7852731-Heterocapsa_arctica.AAC.1
MAVRRPLLSVGLSRHQKLRVDLGQIRVLRKEKTHIPLVAAGALFYMPCLIEEGLRSSDMQYALQQAHDVIDEQMNA